MKLLVGLGNLGSLYAKTRHNAGFLCLDFLYDLAGVTVTRKWKVEKKLEAEVGEIELGGERYILIKPQTYMNDSGRAVQKVLAHYADIDAGEDMMVLYDDLETPLGKWKIKESGSAGGHNGIRSIIAHIGADFRRVKIGIGRPDPGGQAVHDYVLSRFAKKDLEVLERVFGEIATALQ